jgi:hypothetical protein
VRLVLILLWELSKTSIVYIVLILSLRKNLNLFLLFLLDMFQLLNTSSLWEIVGFYIWMPLRQSLTPKGPRPPKRPFLIFGRLPYAPKVVEVSKISWKEYLWIIPFQWDVPCNILTDSSKVMGFWKFQPKFGHALSHCECSNFCPKLPKTAQNYQNLPKSAQICLKTKLWNSTKNQDFSVFQK